ncbi:MAG: SDR family NAD(P)-dependent oxidoreductase [Actinomycetota bacterium]|nr:SDR family NAD(P)-dependent oxidoreductase [Actinomycetota bacterium]
MTDTPTSPTPADTAPGGRFDPTTAVALVTGANRGIGREIAAGLAALGATVHVGSRRLEPGEDVAATLRADGHRAEAVALDVTDSASIAAAADEIGERHGRLDVLVNNAGISGGPAALGVDADLAVIREVFDTNVFGVIAVTAAMLPWLRRSATPRIVNLTSSVGSLATMSDPDHYFTAMPAALAYPPSKTALNALTVQYAKGLRADGILVNGADPGACATDFTAGLPGIERTGTDGARIVVRLATLPPDGPTGAYLAEDGPVPW